jgi:hypothetical protein
VSIELAGTRLEHGEKVATIVAAVIAAVSLITTAVLSYMTLNETRQQGWAYQGSQQCHNYREQVKDLVNKKVSEREIRAWFAAENGGADSPYVNGGGRTALADLERGCAHLELLLAVLDSKAEPTQEMLQQDGVLPEDVATRAK